MLCGRRPIPSPDGQTRRAIVSITVLKTLDRYVIREALTPFLLALGVFTFLLAISPMLNQAKDLLSKGVDLPTVGFLLLTLLPQSLGVTIPMAFMAGLLMALGRLSGDREAVALLACGVSPVRVLRPVMLMAVVVAGINFYMLAEVVPDANQRFRVETFNLLVKKSESDIKPGLFYEGFPKKVLFVREAKPGGGWQGVMLADTSEPGRPVVTLAETGYLRVDPKRQEVAIVLPGESIRYLPGDEAGVYDTARARDLTIAIPADTVFGDGNILVTRGTAEKKIPDLLKTEAEMRAQGLPVHREIMQRHQMFSFPVACLVFALLAVSLGMHTRKEGKMGGFTLGLAVILIYYAVMAIFEGRARSRTFPAEYARWAPNVVLGLVGLAALWWRMKSGGSHVSIRVPAVLRTPPWRYFQTRAQPAAVAGAPGRVVVVIKIPEIYLPKLRVLDVYVAMRFVRVILLASFGLLAIYYVGAFIDRSQYIFKGSADWPTMLAYFYYSTPQFFLFLFPMATLIAVLATIGGLTKSGELVVMRACGISLYRTAAPLLVLSLLTGAGMFLLNDRVLAHSNRKAEALEDKIKNREQHTVNQIANANWSIDANDGRIYYYDIFDTQRKTMHLVSVFGTSTRPFRLTSHMRAERVQWREGRWLAVNGWEQTFPTADRATRESFSRKFVKLPDPELLAGMHSTEADLMTSGELRQHIAKLSQSGFSLAESKVMLYSRLAFPVVTLVMTMIAIPLGVTTGRRGALYGIGLAIMLAASYWLLTTIFAAVGQADLLPPWLAAWATNFLFIAAAGYMVVTVRT